MVRDVVLKLLEKECVNYGGSIVGDFLLKARVELQTMARAAMLCISDRDHAGAIGAARRRNLFRDLFRALFGVNPACGKVGTEFPRNLRVICAMAIVAVQLHGSVRSFQIVAQMNCMVQLDRAGIGAAGADCSKLGMPAVETGYVMREARRGTDGVQVCVALRATGVCRGREPEMAMVLLVTRRAIRLEGLIGVMNRPVVA